MIFGASADEDVLVAGGFPCLRERRLDSVGDERVGRIRERQWLAIVVRDHEDRLVEGRVVAPPALPGVVAPGPSARRPELAASHDLGADVLVRLRHDRSVGVFRTAFHALGFAPGP